jgi:glucuronokinase
VIIKTVSHPRAALIGNPSDGYFGKTIAFLFKNFKAEVILYESPELEILPAEYDRALFTSMAALVHDVRLYGYYGGLRLLKAAVKRFYEYCEQNEIVIAERNFTIRYLSDIPYRLGLAGSSAIITACMRALMSFFGIEIPKPVLANLVLSVEQDELKISAGLQDRVAQAFECPVYMDFEEAVMKRQGYGIYKTMTRDKLPQLYIAWRKDLSEGSEVVHNDFRERYHFKDKAVLDAIGKWKKLTDEVYTRLLSGNKEIGDLINRNFDIRKSVMSISPRNLKMIEAARSAGASAKFTGSGGAIIGTYTDETMYRKLKKNLDSIGVEILIPEIVCKQEEEQI